MDELDFNIDPELDEFRGQIKRDNDLIKEIKTAISTVLVLLNIECIDKNIHRRIVNICLKDKKMHKRVLWSLVSAEPYKKRAHEDIEKL